MDSKTKVKFILLNIVVLVFFYALPIITYYLAGFLGSLVPRSGGSMFDLGLEWLLIALIFLAGLTTVFISVALLGKKYIIKSKTRGLFYLIHFVLLVVLPIFLYVIFVVGK